MHIILFYIHDKSQFIRKKVEVLYMSSENILKLNDTDKSIELIGFDKIDKNGEFTFCMFHNGVVLYSGVREKLGLHFVAKLENGICSDLLIYTMLKDRGFEKENHYLASGDSYYELFPHPFIE